MNQYAQVDVSTDEVTGWFLQPEPPESTLLVRYTLIDPPFVSRNTPRPSPTAKLYHRGGSAVTWEDHVSLELLRLRAIDAIDEEADRARLLAITKQTQQQEYERAEAHALAYKNAGYAGPIPRGVSGWMQAKWRDGLTAQQAADDILYNAEQRYTLLDNIRDARLAAKQDVLHLTTDEITARVSQFKSETVDFLGTALANVKGTNNGQPEDQ